MDDIQTTFLKAYEEHADALFRLCLFKVSDRETATDLLQETFMKVWSYLSEGKKVENLKTFLYRTLGNLIIDHYRKKKTVSLDVLEETGFDIPFDEKEITEAQLDGEKAIKFLKKLPKEYQEVVFMRYVEGLELKEIAEALEEPINTITVRIHRGLRKLKELFPYE